MFDNPDNSPYVDISMIVKVEIHRRETDDLMKEVEDIERGNLEIMAELFECKIEDLKISRYHACVILNISFKKTTPSIFLTISVM